MKPNQPHSRNISARDQSKIKSAIDTLEQLVWLLRGQKLAELDSLVDTLGEWNRNLSSQEALISNLPRPCANKDFLIGTLPGLFQNQSLFPNNEDIVEFALATLGIEISRGDKRSRYEIIGRVICETLELSEYRLANLVGALEIIAKNEDSLRKIAARKLAGGFSWNVTIQELVRQSHE